MKWFFGFSSLAFPQMFSAFPHPALCLEEDGSDSPDCITQVPLDLASSWLQPGESLEGGKKGKRILPVSFLKCTLFGC